VDDGEEAVGTYNVSGFKDASGNLMGADSSNTVSVDTGNPTLIAVHIESNNTDITLAKVGDTVTVTFTTSEALIANPVVTIDGKAADAVTNLGGNNYSATRVMQAGDTQGVVALSIDYTDALGNAGGQVTSTTDASSVSFDESVPGVTDVSSTTPNGRYKIGSTIDVTIAFGETVFVDTAGGTPRLLLETGPTDSYAAYTGGSGTDTLTFRYTPTKGDVSKDLDYVGTNSLELNGGTIRDAAANDALLALPAPGSPGSLGANKNIEVDTLLSEEQGKVIIRRNILNPKKGEFTILNFELEKAEKVNITVYDLNGDPVKVLYNKTGMPGSNEVRWDGRNKRGKRVVQGVYYIVVKIGKKERFVRKVLLVR
jgi:hypothetical protein